MLKPSRSSKLYQCKIFVYYLFVFISITSKNSVISTVTRPPAKLSFPKKYQFNFSEMFSTFPCYLNISQNQYLIFVIKQWNTHFISKTSRAQRASTEKKFFDTFSQCYNLAYNHMFILNIHFLRHGFQEDSVLNECYLVIVTVATNVTPLSDHSEQ